MPKKINDISIAIKNSSLQVAALALYLDVDDTTISKWNSNLAQPSLKRLNEVGEVLEVENSELLSSQKRKQTGLASALQKEYKRLLSSGMKKKIMLQDENGNNKEVNNQEMVSSLRNFVQIWQMNNVQMIKES